MSSYRDRAVAGSGNVRRQPSVLDGLLGGRSRADKEADADAFRNVLVFAALALIASAAGLRWLFLAVGLRFDWWAALPFVPLLLWLLVCGGARQVIRPRGLAELRCWKRVIAAALIAGAVWLLWPLWADPVAQAWQHAHGGWRSLEHGGLRYPLAAVLDAAPAWLGVVAFVLLALGMTAPPRTRARRSDDEQPPAEALTAPDWWQPGRAPGQGGDGLWVA